MIQFNLLPDVKQEFIKAQRLKRTVITVSVIAASSSIAIALLLFSVVNVYQRVQMNDLSKKIDQKSNELKETKDLDRILTVQNQLNNLTALHEAKPSASRLKSYLSQVTPAQVTYAKIDLKLTDNTMEFTGAADSLRTVNQFIDTLKFTKYQVLNDKGVAEEGAETKDAFSSVVLDTFGRDDKGASYKIKLTFDPLIFDNKVKIGLVVPERITTRSVTERPSVDLFQPLSDPEAQEDL